MRCQRRGLSADRAARNLLLGRGHNLGELPIVQVYLARERARRGGPSGVVELMRAAVDDLVREGQLLAWGVPATGVLVETLLDRGADADVAEAEAAIERVARAPAETGLPVRDIWLLRLHALVAHAHATPQLTLSFGIATTTWRNRLASRGTSLGPRRCNDGSRRGMRTS